ncbi:hypothetical protein AKJ16_DCAP13728 [Drosera capensis]
MENLLVLTGVELVLHSLIAGVMRRRNRIKKPPGSLLGLNQFSRSWGASNNCFHSRGPTNPHIQNLIRHAFRQRLVQRNEPRNGKLDSYGMRVKVSLIPSSCRQQCR